MQLRRAVLTLATAAACAVAGCGDAERPGGHTSVMGAGDGKAKQERPALADARGRDIPTPRVPTQAAARVVAAGDDNALALWIQDDEPVAAAYAPQTGWSAPKRLEQIHGDASDPELAANAAGAGMAVWRHTVGSILSLRFSRFDPVAGWSVPDVMPGALPRPIGQAAAPQLQMDAAGNVTAQWPSGFDAHEMQVSRYSEEHGWSGAVSESVASAPSASPALPSPSSVR